jgi:predicted double-glycine peptidase
MGAASFMSTLVYGAPVTYEAVHSPLATTTKAAESFTDSERVLSVRAPFLKTEIVEEKSTSSSPSSSTTTNTYNSLSKKQIPALTSADTKPQAAKKKASPVFTVPFYSQFTDITSAQWKKVGCGIASLAMLIDYYEPNPPSVDTLLGEGIAAHAYQSDAGWTYAGLIGLSKKYGLTGTSHDLSSDTMNTAFNSLEKALDSGPVMVSIHYKFEPKNPIPHLVIANGVRNGILYYNDPAAKDGNLSIPVDTFKNAWKKRYIEIRPIS